MPKWTDSDPEIVRQIVKSGETYISGQVTLATSADQRASVLGGVFTAAGTAAMAALVAAVAAGNVSTGVIVGSLISGILFLFAAGLCISTAMPADFYLSGTRPANWYSDLAEKKLLLEALGEYAENCQEKIDNNSKLLQKNAGRFMFGAYVGIFAPVISLLFWLALTVEWPAS